MRNTPLRAGLMVVVGLMAGTASAGTFAGTVRNADGDPLQGVMVRFTHDASGVSESIPAEERYVVYPVPLSGTYTRDMDFTADGQACTSNNPVPAAALEGGVLQVICIDVQGAQEA